MGTACDLTVGSRLAMGAIIVIGLAGCTTGLSTAPDASTYDKPSYGYPYRMPMKQFDIAVTWRLAKCVPAPSLSNPVGTVEYEITATQTPKVIEGESRVIDYRSIVDRFKTGEVKIKYHPGTLLVESINSTITGKEPEALAGALKLGANVARIALGLPSPGTGGGTPGAAQTLTPCTDTTLEMIAELDKLAARIKKIPEEAKATGDRLAVLRARAIGDRLSDADRAENDTLQAKADKLAEELRQTTDVVAQLESSLTYTETWKFPGKATEREVSKLADAKKIQAWLAPLLRPDASDALDPKNFEVTMKLAPLVADAICPAAGCPALGFVGGFVFRQPVEAALQVSAKGSSKPLLDEEVVVPQFGRLRVLPLNSRWGENNTLAATFSADGVPQTIEYKSTEAAGVKLIGAANDAATTYLGIRAEVKAEAEAEEKAEKEEAEAAAKLPLDQLKSQIELLENQAKLAKLQSAPSPDIQALEAELAILRLQKEQSDLRAAIKANESE
jgi:hypothetical protein